MSFEVTELLGRHNSTSIPKDQQKLLDRHGFGAVGVASHRASLDDVPNHVLSTVTDAYVESRKRDANTARLTPGGRANKSSKTNHSHKGARTRGDQYSHNGSQMTPSRFRPQGAPHQPNPNGNSNIVEQSTPKRLANSTQPVSSPERQFSWSPSERGEEEAENALPSVQAKVLPHNGSHNAEQEPMAAPPRPAVFTRPNPGFEFASSEPEQDLEVELPAPQLPKQTWAHRTTVPESSLGTPKFRHPPAMETPTCAQPSQSVIPGTVVPDPSPPRKVVQEQPRPRRMKPIDFSDSSNGSPKAQPANISTSFHRMASTKTFQEINSSNTTRSSSIVAASLRHSVTPGLHVFSGVEAVPLSMKVQREPHDDDVLPKETVVQEQQPSLGRLHGENDQLPTSIAHDAPDQPTHSPFEKFIMAYPSYITKYLGTLMSFIKACICLEHMSKHRSLNHFLWDDFIRAFSAEYLGYVRLTAKPLVASEWYNDREEPPLFQDKIVHKGNLHLILRSYPNEVAKAKRHIVGDDGQDETNRPKTATIRPPPPKLDDKVGDVTTAPERKRDVSTLRPQASTPRSVSHPTPGSGPAHTNGKTGEIETSSNLPSRERHPSRNLGSRTDDLAASTPRLSSGRVATVQDSTPKSSPRSTPFPSGYLKRLQKPRTPKEQEKIREHIRRQSSGSRPTSSRA